MAVKQREVIAAILENARVDAAVKVSLLPPGRRATNEGGRSGIPKKYAAMLANQYSVIKQKFSLQKKLLQLNHKP